MAPKVVLQPPHARAHMWLHICVNIHTAHRVLAVIYNKSWALLSSDWLDLLLVVQLSVGEQGLKAIDTNILCALGLF